MYGLIPFSGAFYLRYKWQKFRRRFNSLRAEPLLDYNQYREKGSEDGIFRFTGSLESITDGHTLWVKGDRLTVPVSLTKTKCWLLPLHKDEGVPDAPEQIRWNRVSTFSEGTKVFIGGCLKMHNNRLSFISAKDKPLTVIFYNCRDDELSDRITRAARTRNEYLNPLTPVSLVIGALSLLYIAALYVNRPAYRMTVITSFIAIFVPLLPIFPPGFLFTVLYRRLIWQARRYRAYWDIALLPLRTLLPGKESSVLYNGEKYGYIKLDLLPPEALQSMPYLIPEIPKDKKNKTQNYLFGILNEDSPLPVKSKDPFISFGILPDSPRRMATRYAVKAYSIELLGCIALILGMATNIVFIFMILRQFNLVF